MADLYDAVGHGMWAYSNAAFRVEVLGGEKPDPGPGTLVAVTHGRKPTCPSSARRSNAVRRPAEHHRPHALRRRGRHVRAGFFARFPPDLPLRGATAPPASASASGSRA